MTIPVEFVCLLLGSVLAVQGWTLREVIGLKAEVAMLKGRLLSFHSDTEHLLKQKLRL
jgi:hypothetical protein